MHLTLLLGITQIHILQRSRILFTSLLAENKIDHWKKFIFPQMIDQMCPDILIKMETSS